MNIIEKNINIILYKCGQLKNDEKLLIIYDETTKELAKLFYDIALQNLSSVISKSIMLSNMHGNLSINKEIELLMLNSDLIIGITKFSLAHTKARYNASKLGAKYLSLADYDIELLKRDCIDVDYEEILPQVDKLTELLTNGNSVKIKSELGTNLILNIKNRVGNSASGIVRKGEIGSPPDIESNIAIVEELTNGNFIVDGSIPCKEIGKVNNNFILDIKNGKIINIEGKESHNLKEIFKSQSELAKVPAELGFGFNNKAKFSGYMLEDEGVYGSVHIGFGSNITIGGKNDILFHLDMVISKPDVWIDDKQIIKKGEHIF